MAIAKRWGSAGVVLLVGWLSLSLRARADGAGSAPLADDPTLIALAVALSCADAPDGVERAPGDSPGAGAEPEIELIATIRAKALRFDAVPDGDVVLRAAGKRRTVWKAERVNLPVHPERGVVYRDVQVRLSIATDADELAAMLREARRAARGIRIDGDAPAGSAAQAAPAAPVAAPAPITAPTAPSPPIAPPAPVATAPVEVVAPPAPAEQDPAGALPPPPPPPPLPEASVPSATASTPLSADIPPAPRADAATVLPR